MKKTEQRHAEISSERPEPFREGSSKAQPWINQSEFGIWYNFTLRSSYKDKATGKRRESGSFKRHNLPEVSVAALRAFLWYTEELQAAENHVASPMCTAKAEDLTLVRDALDALERFIGHRSELLQERTDEYDDTPDPDHVSYDDQEVWN